MARGTAPFSSAALRDARRRRRVDGRLLSAAELARRVGTSKSRILAYEKGTSVPEPQRIEQLARVFGIPPRRLCPPASDTANGIRRLRVAAGLTSAEAAEQLGISRNTYRDLELHAKLPARQHGTLPQRLAEVFAVSTRAVHRSLDSHPQTTERREEIARLLAALFLRAHETGRPATVGADEPDLQSLAALLRRSTGITCRLVDHELGRLRDDLRERAAEEATAAYGQHEDDIRRARDRIVTLTERIDRAAVQAAGSWTRFLAEAMTGRQWRLVVRLLNAEPVPDGRLLEFGDLEAWQGLAARGLITRERIPEGGAGGFVLTPTGLARALHEARLYTCLYPRVSAPSRTARVIARRKFLDARRRWTPAAPVHNRPTTGPLS
ncbi:helix-turn-helix domain-containing protein [Streptomyces sp. NPDC001068]|uniref:helix-turn-helix domain-containing protein n=1 Tax=Streptomyces sp. NPDC001068 TaxID=3364544 RepID=UPI003684D185